MYLNLLEIHSSQHIKNSVRDINLKLGDCKENVAAEINCKVIIMSHVCYPKLAHQISIKNCANSTYVIYNIPNLPLIHHRLGITQYPHAYMVL